MFGARQIGGREFDQRLYSPRRQQYGQRSAEERQQQAFGQQLPRQPETARAQCRAHGEFLAPRLAARERQIGHVGAGDEQDEADRAQQQPERSANIAHHFIQQRRDEDGHLVVLDRILAPQRGGDLIELRLRLFDGNALFQAPHHHQEVVATLSLIFRQARRRPDFVSRGKLKLRRRNADDRMRFSVELDGFSDDRFLAAKAATPQTGADDGDARRPGSVIRREKKAPAFRFEAEELKEIGRDVTTHQSFRRIGFGQNHRFGVMRDERIEDLLLRDEIAEGGGGYGRAVHRRLHAVNPHQSLRLAIRQGPQDDGVDDAENRRRRPDAERQRDDGNQREAGFLQ